MNTIKTTVYLNAADYRRLKSLAADRGRSAAELVREAVAEYAERAAQRLMPTSIGLGDSGIPDLAERDEELMDGFGAEGVEDIAAAVRPPDRAHARRAVRRHDADGSPEAGP